MMLYVSLILLCFSCVYSQEWDRHEILDQEENFHVYWSIIGDTITFQVEVATKGWVGFGFSETGGMAGSDVIIGWIAENGSTIFHDRYAEGTLMPEIDEKQDWILLWSNENDTHTSLKFKRLLNTCDNRDILINDETMKMIYAFHPDDPASPLEVVYHGHNKRGTKNMLVLNNVIRKKVENPKDLHHWDLRAPNIEIPYNRDTEYYCTLFKRKDIKTKHHYIEIVPLIQRGNERFVHHMVLYECTNVKEETIKPFLNQSYHKCYNDDVTPKFSFCFTIAAGWTVGGKSHEFPKHVGMPFGEADASWFVLETHYDNPGLVKGVTDNSGLRITYTPKLRPYDSSVVVIGALWYPCMFIPPNQRNFLFPGHSVPECLKQRLPPEGIRVFAVLLHSHYLGRKMVVRHFRDNEELPPLINDTHYDFNFQVIRFFSKERTILPEDHLVTECTFDSTKRNHSTFAGFSSRDEMCTVFLYYYPRLSFSYSVSCPFPANVLSSLGVTEVSNDAKYLISPISGKNETYMDFLHNYPWDETSINAVQNAIHHGPHINMCSDRYGKVLKVPILSEYPKVTKIYKKPNKCMKEEIAFLKETVKTKRKPPTIPFDLLDQLSHQII